tara:strand:- start:58 stop:618 length:561 start_codon:yes stop_codon:yes gene_type:complete
MKVGYARVSSVDGSQETGLDTQVQLLKKNGCDKIFTEQKSGTTTKGRNALRDCLDFVREGDEFVFTRIDRVCRNILDLQLIVKELNEKGVVLNATEQPISTKDASSKCFLDMLGVFSEFETNLRRERQLEGIARAKEKGVYQGRKAKIDIDRIKVLKQEGLGATAIAKEMNIHRDSVYRLLKKVGD